MVKVILKNLTKKFGTVVAVDNLNLEIEDGEFVVLVGPSGCGKTTALRLVAGLEEATEGDIYFNGQRVNDLKPIQRDVAMVFQSYALYPHMTVFDNMSFPLKLKKAPKEEIKEKVEKTSGLLGVQDLLHRKPRELSGGQRQRVALGRAIVRNPKVFLMDEPLSNLDAKLRVHMRAELKRLHKEVEATTIYVTHDQAEAMTLADRVAILDKGKLQQYDTPLNCYNHPNNLFVAGFIGSPAMNFIGGRLIAEERQCVFDAGLFKVNLTEKCFQRLPKTLETIDAIYGIRPEDIEVSKKKTENGIESIVYDAEPMGDEVLVYFKLAEKILIARVKSTLVLSMNEKIWVNLTSENAHAFDAKTENALF
jgi:multiple sugar transport system ATP-binding protein